ncbi:MAG: hypothetical protein MUC42_01995 [Bryobacter sp.]|nr:hypothetical protein [Bryobacter sp.]
MTALLPVAAQGAGKREISGIYPHLATFNNGSECGTGAVVPWAGKLWVVSYSPHSPGGSDDKLYEIDEALTAVIRPESIGGTPANRMIHAESGQLFLGPYAIDKQRRVRVIPYEKAYGRPTGNARHLTDPARKIYLATMEEGFYEIDVQSLAVKMLYEDANAMRNRKATAGIEGPLLPGYHGKGFYSGQGKVVYANNGEVGGDRHPPSIPSGCLAEWDGEKWTVVRRNQFCEVTGPGGLSGNPNPATDPVWSIGWDHRSLILMMLDGGRWHTYRLPKATHTYDGAHGWNTEWPRIREIGERDLLMTMHGMFWRFPASFRAQSAAGIRPRSTYLKVVGDFARWGDRVVLGCDDSAKSEFANKRKAKGEIAGPGQSQSNLWFLPPAKLDQFGTPIGRGAVWIQDDLAAGATSDPYLFGGFDQRIVHLTHQQDSPVAFTLEVDRTGSGRWEELRKLSVPARGYSWAAFPAAQKGEWVRLRAASPAAKTTAFFQYSNLDPRTPAADPAFQALAKPGASDWSGGLVWARGDNKRTLLFAARTVSGGRPGDEALYELDGELRLRRIDDRATLEWMNRNVAIPKNVLEVDAASVIYRDEKGHRWRLPKGDSAFDQPGALGPMRVAREVSTERDLLNAHGSFYELPAENAGGIGVVRPIATHNRLVSDYCSFRGLAVLSGLSRDAADSAHVVRSDDGRVALWLGVSDDFWRLGKARGRGGPWSATPVRAGEPSDPYLMTGYDRKKLTLRHTGGSSVKMTVEVDLTGAGLWVPYREFSVGSGPGATHDFPAGYAAYWLRVVAASDCTATATLEYS